jgi:hypothetical protein
VKNAVTSSGSYGVGQPDLGDPGVGLGTPTYTNRQGQTVTYSYYETGKLCRTTIGSTVLKELETTSPFGSPR